MYCRLERQGSKISQQAHYGDLLADLMSSMFQCDTKIISFVSLFSRSYSIATRQLWQGTEKGTNRVQRSKLRFCAFYMHPAAVEHSNACCVLCKQYSITTHSNVVIQLLSNSGQVYSNTTKVMADDNGCTFLAF